MKPKLKVTQEDPPIEKEVLARAIVQISDGVKKLYESGLNKNGVVALLKDKTGHTKATITAILDGLAELKSHYCR